MVVELDFGASPAERLESWEMHLISRHVKRLTTRAMLHVVSTTLRIENISHCADLHIAQGSKPNLTLGRRLCSKVMCLEDEAAAIYPCAHPYYE
eukprot:6485285-Amphidinium_carterae.2